MKAFDFEAFARAAVHMKAIDELPTEELTRGIVAKLYSLDQAELATVAGFILGMRGEIEREDVRAFLSLARGRLQ